MNRIYYILTVLTFMIYSCKDKSGKNLTNEEVRNLKAVAAANDITGNFTSPPLSQPGQGAYLSGELIYPLDNKPTPECHASSIVETPTGLVSAFFAGTHEKNPDFGIRVSRMVDGKWTLPEEVVNGVKNDTLCYPLWNPVLFQPKKGPLLLFYKEGPDPITWWGMLMTSPDDGITWSKPEKMGTDEKIGHLLGPIKNKPIQLADGTKISPTNIEYKLEDGDVHWIVYFEISKDNGKTWEVVGPINDGKEFDAIQPSILNYPNGKMQVLCRTRQNVISQS